MNPNGTNYSWSNTAQWSQVPGGTPNDQSAQAQNAYSTQANYSQNNGSYQAQPQQYSQPQPSISAESRKDVITRLYQTILGREPDTAGLNYYLYNSHIPENQIAKEMYESTEHNDLLAKAKDIREMIKKTEETTKKMSDMEYNLQSLQSINENFKSLIDQKTHMINELRSRLNLSGEDVQIDNNPHQVHYSHEAGSPQSFLDGSEFLLDDPFADENNKRPGCLGWISNWFKFS